jgi:hypothetical protein
MEVDMPWIFANADPDQNADTDSIWGLDLEAETV